jgi:hypothetical protein
MDLVPYLGQMPLDRLKDPSLEPTVPLTTARADEIGSSDLSNRTVRFVHFVCEDILVTLLGNRLLQARQA